MVKMKQQGTTCYTSARTVLALQSVVGKVLSGVGPRTKVAGVAAEE